MTEAQKIVNEISHVGKKLKRLKQTLRKIQQECQHEFIKASYYQRCKKCLKVETLYY